MNKKKISILFLCLVILVLFIVLIKLKVIDPKNEIINTSNATTETMDETHTVTAKPNQETNSASTPPTTTASPTSRVVAAESSEQSSETGSKQTSDDVSKEYNDAITAYNNFLTGSINAEDSNQLISDGTVNISDISLEPDFKTYYALFDMNRDGIPELHLRPIVGGSYAVFTYRNGIIVLWHNGPDYESPLNNGAILYQRDGAAPTHINYYYLVLDSEGNEISKVYFSKYHSIKDNGLSESADYDVFEFDEKDISKDEWISLTNEYLSISSDLIKWEEIK